MTRLRLDGNLFSSVPDLSSATQLQELYLASNKISDVVFPESYRLLLNLTLLYLDKNYINRVFTKEKWKNLHTEHIKDFSCGGCYAPLFEDGFFTIFPNLEKIFLANVYKQTTMESIIQNLAAATKLKKLDISDTISAKYDLNSFFFSPLNNTALEELILTESVFSKIPSGLFVSLSKLKVLTMKACKIYDIESGAFQGLVNLESLYLDGSLTGYLELGHGLFPPSLQTLSLSTNYLPYFSYDNTMFRNLTNLRWLRLSNCFIDFIPPDMLPPSLVYLDLSNIIFDLGMSQIMLKGLTNLTTLDLTSTLTNQQVTQELFKDLYSLRRLILSKNNIHDLAPGMFRNLKVLDYLDLSYNALSSSVDLDKQIFNMLPNLMYVSFFRNTISHILETEYMKSFLNRNQTLIDLSNNTFECSCDNVMFYKWFQNETVRDHFIEYENYICQSPEKYAGRKLADNLLVDDVENSCGQIIKFWEIILFVASAVVTVVALIILFTYYRRRLYLRRLLKYKIREQADKYSFYLSYFSDDYTRVKQIAEYLETLPQSSYTFSRADSDLAAQQFRDQNTSGSASMTVGSDLNEGECVLNIPTASTPVNEITCRVYYEDRDAEAYKWELEQLARAIYSATSVILCLTPDYLRDRRRQYEMVLVQDAMVTRFGSDANDHIILINLREPEETASHIPVSLRGHYKKHVIVWSEDEQQQHRLLTTLEQKLSNNKTMS